MALYDNVDQHGSAAGPAVRLLPFNATVSLVLILCAIVTDVCLLVVSGTAASLIYSELSGVVVDVSRSRECALVIAALFVTLSVRDGTYSPAALAVSAVHRIAIKWLVSLGLFLVIAFLFKSGAYYSRGVVLVLTPIGFIALLSGRLLVGRIAREAITQRNIRRARVAVIGSGLDTEALLRTSMGEDPSVELTCYAELGSDAVGSEALKEVLALSQVGRIDQILVALPWSRMRDIEATLAEMRKQALPVLLLPDLGSLNYISRPTQVGGLPAFEVKRAALAPTDLIVKRLLDLIIATVAMLILSPLLVATAIAIKFESPGPVFFRQRRHGFNNREFRIFKFRSMRVAEDGEVVKQATRNDPRVTTIGAVIRRTSIDELPQLLNVIRGEMSIVGPRPHAVAHNDAWSKMVEGYAQRHNILPGITGLAQVNGYRGETDTPEKLDARVRLDIQYIETWSIGLEIKIILKTIAVLFFQRQAY